MSSTLTDIFHFFLRFLRNSRESGRQKRNFPIFAALSALSALASFSGGDKPIPAKSNLFGGISAESVEKRQVKYKRTGGKKMADGEKTALSRRPLFRRPTP